MSFADYEGPVRERGYRIPDLHGYSPLALSLYLHPALFRMVELIFDEPALVFQSLYFEHGSAQGLHRDPMFVATHPTSNLCPAWIALEDITADSGPLAYVPGSHRLPWFEFEPGTVVCKQSVGPEQRAEFASWVRETIREKGLERRAFTCKRGDAFIWQRRARARRRGHRESGTDAQELRGALHDRGRLQVANGADGGARRDRVAPGCAHDRDDRRT
jgi:Phytanoyl-CoA dioxygenase (PhyH)